MASMRTWMTVGVVEQNHQLPISNARFFSGSFQRHPQFLAARLAFSPHLNRWILKHAAAKPISAVGSGLEASITDPKDNSVSVKNAKVVVESQEENKLQLRVDLPGDETQKIFNRVLTDLARTAPPIPGFRRQKGGKTSKVPRDFLIQVLGEKRVTNFVIQEIVSSTMADYAKKENLKVKDNKIETVQKAEELKKLFTPGNEFGFNAVLELEETKSETTD